MAQWLRENPRLDKKMIGEYVSDRKNMELLDSFVKYVKIPICLLFKWAFTIVFEGCTNLLKDHFFMWIYFCSTFTFQGLRIDEALRLYLEAFRLPGEAPVIQRLLETFTDNWHVRLICSVFHRLISAHSDY